MHFTKHCFAHIALSGRIFVIGGTNENWEAVSTVETYDPLTNEWETMAPLLQERQSSAVCASKGYIYALGGRNGEVFIDSIERYDPSEDSWMLVGFVRFVNGMKLFMDSVFFLISFYR